MYVVSKFSSKGVPKMLDSSQWNYLVTELHIPHQNTIQILGAVLAQKFIISTKDLPMLNTSSLRN